MIEVADEDDYEDDGELEKRALNAPPGAERALSAAEQPDALSSHLYENDRDQHNAERDLNETHCQLKVHRYLNPVESGALTSPQGLHYTACAGLHYSFGNLFMIHVQDAVCQLPCVVPHRQITVDQVRSH